MQWSLQSLETIQPHDQDNYTPVNVQRAQNVEKFILKDQSTMLVLIDFCPVQSEFLAWSFA